MSDTTEEKLTDDSVVLIDIKENGDLQCKFLKPLQFNNRLIASMCNLLCDATSRYVEEPLRKEFEDSILEFLKEMVEKRYSEFDAVK